MIGNVSNDKSTENENMKYKYNEQGRANTVFKYITHGEPEKKPAKISL